MLYSIAYTLNDITQEERVLKKLKSLGDAAMIMPHCYYLQSTMNRNDIFNELRSTMNDSDLLYIAETPVEKMSGWLPTSAIDWLNQLSK